MPKRIIVVGVLFCLIGLPEIWNTITNSLNSEPKRLMLSSNLLFTIPFLIAGIGLLLRKLWSQKLSRALLIIGYIFIIFTIVFPNAGIVSWSGQDMTGALALMVKLFLLGLLILIHWLLYTHKANEYLNPPLNQNLAG